MSDATTLWRARVCCVRAAGAGLTPGAVKGPWQKHEDEIILKCLEEGVTKWSDIADRVTGRIGKQCRERFLMRLDRESTGGLSLPLPTLALLSRRRLQPLSARLRGLSRRMRR